MLHQGELSYHIFERRFERPRNVAQCYHDCSFQFPDGHYQHAVEKTDQLLGVDSTTVAARD
jgi:hypothetical protein